MSRVCDVTGRKPMYGNNVSHAHNKSRRRFDINLQKKRFWLPDEKRWITLRVSTQGLRLIDKIGIRKVVNRMKASVEEEIARRDQVVYLLDKAEELFSKRYITEPGEDNVVAISREIERIDPGNINAAQLLERSSRVLVQVAEEAYKFNMREDAEHYLNLAFMIMPDSESGKILYNKLRKDI